MAARTRKQRHDDFTREKIRTSQLVNRLQDHVLDRVEMKPTQVQAALGLLKKSLPDLNNVEVTGKDGGALVPAINVVITHDKGDAEGH